MLNRLRLLLIVESGVLTDVRLLQVLELCLYYVFQQMGCLLTLETTENGLAMQVGVSQHVLVSTMEPLLSLSELQEIPCHFPIIEVPTREGPLRAEFKVVPGSDANLFDTLTQTHLLWR